ncbi:MAG: hypothetical protein Q4D19_09795 [Lautropia sp.]|nr:hypothetical protein [Lautropia sp.]
MSNLKNSGLLRVWQVPGQRSIADEFIKGFVATGLLSSLQTRDAGKRAGFSQQSLRLAVQGGTALAAGTAAIQAMRAGRHGTALLAVAAGAAGVLAAERYLKPSPEIKRLPLKEIDNGTEEQ